MSPIVKIIAYISLFSVLMPIIFLLKRKQNFKSAPIRVLGILLFASAFSDFGGYILIKMGKSNISIANIYTLTQFILLSSIYYLLLEKKKIIYFGLIISTIFFIMSNLFIESFNEFQSWSALVGGLFILIYSISYYRQLLKSRIDLLRFTPFWINTAVYFYFAFDLFLFAITNYMIKNMPADIAIIAWSFHNCNNVIKNILFAIAISYVGAKQAEAYDGKKM